MKERLEIAEKSLLLFIPYLIVLSLAYYWGYWGYFNIDAISYYGVQDLIKGFTYALPVVLLLGIMLIVINVLIDQIVLKLRKRFNKWITLVICLIPSIFILWLLFDKISDNKILHWESIFILIMVFSTILEGFFKALNSWDWATNNPASFFATKWATIFCFVSFVSSFAYGRDKAMNINDNKYFSYMLLTTASDTTKPKQLFKYLGKAGDSHFFLSPDNKEKRIIAASILPTLILHECNVSDSASVRAYNTALLRKNR
jgi:hypothetical protein